MLQFNKRLGEHPFSARADASPSSIDGATPLRIVHVCRQYRPAVGGLEMVIEALARRQRSEGHDVTVVTLDRVFSAPDVRLPASEVVDGVRVTRIPFFGSRRYPIAPQVLRHVKGASVVHVHGIDFFFDFLAATRFIHRRPLIATTHGGFFHTSFMAALKKLWFTGPTRFAASRYDAIVACSQQDEQTFRPITPANLVTIENGVDVDRFKAVACERRREMLYFGRLSPNKGIKELLAWFAAVRVRAPDWKLTIAGRADGVTIPDLIDRIAVHGLAGSVRLIDSPSDERLAELVSQASVYVSASRYEGFGLAPIEAASGGLFPVLQDIPPFRRVVERMKLGVITNFGTAAPQIDAVLGAVEQWRTSGNAAPALDGFSWDTAAERYRRVYRHCLGVDTRRIGKVAVRVTDRQSVIDTFDRHVAERKPLTIAFCNVHTVNMAERDDGMAAALGSALVVNDGVGVDTASRLLFGAPFPENLNGTDLTPDILDRSARDLRIYLVGGEPGVAHVAAEAIGKAYPRHTLVGAHHGFLKPTDENPLLRRIKAARPDLILVGMGHPFQEIWAAKYAPQLPGVTMCVGALLDRFADKVKRAPEWIRRANGEWAYRLVREPRRLAGRYIVGNALFLARLSRQHGNGRPRLR